MKKLIGTGLAMLAILSLSAQPEKVRQEKKYIKEMCGCYEVDFEYAETFAPDNDYKFHDRYATGGLEWIFVDEESEDKLVLQHLLVANDTMIIKHWRQDWEYENQDLLKYRKNLEWKKKHISKQKADGTWTQKVYQVDDSPRYEGYATWIDVDGKKYWESTVDAPLPRRERTKRSDYNVMRRTNKHEITKKGHVHELDNAKIIRTEEKDSVLVYEKGRNTYTKVDDSRCEAARKWWDENRPFWVDVRHVWADIIENHEYINIEGEIDGKRLYHRLFALGHKQMAKEEYNSEETKKKIRETIDPYLSSEPSPWERASNKK